MTDKSVHDATEEWVRHSITKEFTPIDINDVYKAFAAGARWQSQQAQGGDYSPEEVGVPQPVGIGDDGTPISQPAQTEAVPGDVCRIEEWKSSGEWVLCDFDYRIDYIGENHVIATTVGTPREVERVFKEVRIFPIKSHKKSG